MTTDATAPVNPDVSIFVDDVNAAHDAAIASDVEIVYPLVEEEWGVRRFFYRDSAGRVINVGHPLLTVAHPTRADLVLVGPRADVTASEHALICEEPDCSLQLIRYVSLRQYAAV